MCDVVLSIYLLIAVVATYGSAIFLWWLIRNGLRATSVYLYVTLLLIGESVRSWTNVYGRQLSLANDGSFLAFSMGWVWEARSLLTLAAMSAIVAHMTYRIVTGRNPEVPEEWAKKIRKWICKTRLCE